MAKKEKQKSKPVPRDIIKEIEAAFGDVEILEQEERKMADQWDTTDAGQYVFGEISRISDSEFGKMYFIRTPKGKEFLLKNRRALNNQLEDVKKGDRILITCLGYQPATKKGGKEFVGYEVRKIKGGAPF